MNDPKGSKSARRAAPKGATSARVNSTEKRANTMISSEVETALHEAFVNARKQRHEFVTVEHLLFSLLDLQGPKAALFACGANVDELKSRLTVFIDENTPVASGEGEVDTQPTLGFQRIVQRAIIRAQSPDSAKRSVSGLDLLLSTFGEKDSHAVYYLHQQGVTRLDVQNFIEYGEGHVRTPATFTGEAANISAFSALQRKLAELLTEQNRQETAKPASPIEQPKLFISYSHVDSACIDRLLVHLKPLERSNTVVCWSDRRIRTGDKWRTELEKNLDEAVIAILLISADFLASDFIVNNELPPLLVKADAKGLRILPVILKPCGFRRDPILSSFQSANDPAVPLLGLTEIEQEAIYDKIAEEVAREVNLRSTQRDSSST